MDTPLVVPQGTDTKIVVRNVRDANGTLIAAWTNYSVRSQVRADPSSATVLYEWTSQGGTPNAAFVGSSVELDIPHTVSAAWAWITGRYDVELTDPVGKVSRIAEGPITVSREVTR